MHVLSKSTVANRAMPGKTRSYMEGTGKHQKLFSTLVKDVMGLHNKWAHADSELKAGLYGANSLYGAGMFVTVGALGLLLKCMIKVYKEIKTHARADIIATRPDRLMLVRLAECQRASRGQVYEEYYKNKRFTELTRIKNKALVYIRHAMNENERANERMHLEKLMDTLLVWGNREYRQLLAKFNDMYKARQPGVPNINVYGRPLRRQANAATVRKNVKNIKREVFRTTVNPNLKARTAALRRERRAEVVKQRLLAAYRAV